MRKNIPTLSTFYLLKNLSALKKNLLPQLESLHESHGDIFGIKLNNLKCFIRKPEYIKHVLVDNHQNYEKGDGFLAFKPLIGNGLLTSDGDKWVKDRKILSPVFANGNKEHFYNLALGLYNKSLSLHISDKKMNLTECLNYYFIHLVWVEIFNFPFEDSLEELKRYFREYDTFITNQQKALIKFPYWMPIPYFKRAMNAKDELRLFAKRALSKTQEGSLTNFISVMKMGHYPEDQIIDQILTAFIGGNESSYNSTQFTFLLLRDHPEFLSKLVTEISVNPNLTNFTDIDALPYLDAVIKESLRLYPTIPLFPRVAKSEDQLDDYILQKGDMIAMSPWTMHRAEKYWPKALEFKPERFFEKNFEREFIYFPFALGPRKCIGAAMATVNMKTFIYHLIQDYTFSIGGPSLKNIIHKVSLVPAGDLSLFDITKK